MYEAWEVPVKNVKKDLLPGEVIVYKTGLHWVNFIIILIILLWFLLYSIFSFLGREYFMGFIFFILTVVGSIYLYLDYKSTEFIITNKRIIHKNGIFDRKNFDLFLSRIEGVGFEQGIIGKVLNFGTITITGLGGRVEKFSLIDKPQEFYKKAREQIAISQHQTSK